MTIASSLELHLPFSVHQHVELALRMPHRFHYLGNWLPRQLCAGLFCSGSLNRAKEGRVLLMAAWISQQLHGFGDRVWNLLVLRTIAQRLQML